MKHTEIAGILIGSLTGAVLGGVCVYFTQNASAALIPAVGFLAGGKIGREIGKRKK